MRRGVAGAAGWVLFLAALFGAFGRMAQAFAPLSCSSALYPLPPKPGAKVGGTRYWASL